MCKYIVILNGGHSKPAFLVDETDEACLFDDYPSAEKAAEDNPLGKARGYKIITWFFND